MYNHYISGITFFDVSPLYIVHDWFCVDGVGMSDASVAIPEGYEIVRTISTSD